MSNTILIDFIENIKDMIAEDAESCIYFTELLDYFRESIEDTQQQVNTENINEQENIIENSGNIIENSGNMRVRTRFNFLDPIEEVDEYINETKVGLDIETLTNNTIVKIDESNEMCAICQETMNKQIVRQNKCLHFFHINCIEQWFFKNNDCPLCRKVI